MVKVRACVAGMGRRGGWVDALSPIEISMRRPNAAIGIGGAGKEGGAWRRKHDLDVIENPTSCARKPTVRTEHRVCINGQVGVRTFCAWAIVFIVRLAFSGSGFRTPSTT